MDTDAGFEYIDQMLAVRQDLGYAWYLKGAIYNSRWEDEKATSCFEEAVKYQKDDPMLWYALYDACDMIGEYEKAYYALSVCREFMTWEDYYGDGYQLAQSLITIGSGGLLGVGLGRGRQKFLYLPEQYNDFIFSVICEELGLIGACVIMLIFSMLILRGFWIALHARDRFGALLTVGVMTHLALQTFLNIAVVSGFVPTTGISLPFFSYGGTALCLQLVEMGIVLSVSRQIPAARAG